jgi:hypothetical protein
MFTRIVWCWHVQCDVHKHKYNFWTQSVISTRRVWLRHSQLWFKHAQEWLLYAECDVAKNECDYDTHESDYDTLRVEITLVCDVHTHTVMNTRTSINSERKEWFQHARVWFTYVEWDFYTHSVISTRRVWFLHAECDFCTQSVISTRSVMCKSDFYTQSVILTHMDVITTRTSVICTHTSWYFILSTWYVNLQRTN